jgi:putative membrane protein
MLIEPLLNGTALALVVPAGQLLNLVIQTLIFAVIGVLVFAVAFWIIVKACPFSVRKEIEEDQNVAIAIVIGAIIIGIALVVAAAIQG